jgi:hypothetical protein
MPTMNVRVLKLLFNTGFEWFLTDPPLEGYIFAITDGPEEVISLGKKIVDGEAVVKMKNVLRKY